MEFDFTNTSDSGFAELPLGRYPIVTTKEWWIRKKEDTDRYVLDVDVEVTRGKYKGENPRYFHSFNDTETSLGFMLKFLRGVGIIVEGDRKKDGSLRAEFVYGEKDDNGRVRIKAIEVNGEERKVHGYKAVAVVTKSKSKGSDEEFIGINQFEQDAGGNASKDSETKDTDTPAKKGGLPF